MCGSALPGQPDGRPTLYEIRQNIALKMCNFRYVEYRQLKYHFSDVTARLYSCTNINGDSRAQTVIRYFDVL